MHFGFRRRSPTTRKRARIAAALCVAAAAWLGQPAWAQTTPSINAVAFTSDPGTDRRYGVSDEIVATITFSEVVHVFEGEVSGVQHGQLHLLLTVGANTRQAQFCGGSGSTMLQFCYRVAGGDEDTDGVSIGNLGAALVGGVIQSAGGTDATRAFNAIASDANHRVDGVAPAVARDNRGFHRVHIVSDAGADQTYGFGEAIEIEISFNEIVSVLGDPTIILTIGENSRRAAFRGGSGTEDLRFRYLVRADDRDDDGINIGPGTDAGGSQLSFVGGTITDLAGNVANRRFDGLAADPAHAVDGGMDVDPPAVVVDGVAITSTPGNYAAGEFIEITVTFDEPVHVSGEPTLALRVGTADRAAALVDGGNGRAELRFRYRVQPGEEDDNGVAIPANALALNGATIADGAGNAAQLFFPSPGAFPAHRVAAIAPFVRNVAFTSTPSDGATYQAGESITVQVAFEDPDLTVSGAPTLELAIGNPPNRRMALQRATGGVLVFAYTVRAGDVDNDGIEIPAGPDTLAGGTLRDQVGNLADRAFSAVRANHDVAGGSDTVAPSVRGVTIASRPENTHTYLSGERITLAVTFDEPVQVSGAPTIPIRVGAATRNATASTAVEATRLLFHYAIQNGDADANGVSVEAGATLGGAAIEDRSGNAANPALPQLPDQPAHRVDATPPAPTGSPIIASTPGHGTAYEAGEVIRTTLSFGEAVRVDGEPTLTLVVGANDRTMRYQGGSHTDTLSFAYTVLPGEMDTNGVSVRRDALSLNGGTLRDAVGNNAVLTHAALADDASHQVDGGADTAPPTIEQVLVEDGPTVLVENSKFFAYGDEIPVVVVFNEPVFVTGDPTVTIEIGGQPRTASYHGGSGTERLTFRYGMDAIDNGGIIVTGSTLRRNGGTLQDAAGNDADTTYRTVWNTCCRADGLAPRVETVELISNAGLDNVYKRGEAIAACVTFTEPIVVAHAPSLTLDIRIGDNTRRARLVAAESAQSCAADHQIAFEYTVQASDQDRDGVHIDPGALAGGAITDHVGNSADLRRLVLPTQPDHRVDGNAAGATASIVSDPGDDNTYAAGDEIRVRVDLLRASDGMEGNLVLTIGNLDREATLESRRPSQLTYIYTVQPGDEDTDGISIRADALRDNPKLVPIENAAGHRVDAVPPGTARLTVASDPGEDETYAAGDAIEVHVVFNEPVWVDAVPRLRLAIGRRTPAAAYRSGSGSTTLRFRYVVQSGDFDDDGIDIGANALIDGTIADGAGNELDAEGRRLAPLLAQSGHKVDAGNDETDEQPPRVDFLRITSTPQVGDTYATGETIEVQVIFSEAANVLEVGVVGGQQVELERPVLQLELGCRGQTVSRSARLAPEDDASDTLTFRYTTVAGDCDDDGVSIPANALTGGAIVDYSTAANEAIRAHGALLANGSHLVDGVAPRPTSKPWFTSRPRAGSYGVGEAITVRVAFGEQIFVSGQPTLRLNIGNTTKDALFTRVTSQDNVMEFQYVVQSGDSDDDGVSIAPDALSGGRIQDAVGNAWSDRRLLTLASDAGHRVDGASDNLPPVVTCVEFYDRPQPHNSCQPPRTGQPYGLNEYIHVRVKFNERVFIVAGTPAVRLSIGAEARSAIYLTGDGTETLTFRYLVQPNDFDDDGISIGPNALSGATLQDTAGNAATLTFRGLPQDSSRKVIPDNQTAPTVRYVRFSSMPAGQGPYGLDAIIELQIMFDERVQVTGQPALLLTIGDNNRRANYANGSGTSLLVFRYRVQAGDFDRDGIFVASNALVGGTIEDFSGNAAARAFDDIFPTLPQRVDALRPVAARPPKLADREGDGEWYERGDVIKVDVEFNEIVHVTGEPVLTLAIGTASRPARYAGGSGTAILQFRYQVQRGDVDQDGVSIGPNALAGGVIEDVAGNDWGDPERRLPALPNRSSHKVNAGVNTDAPNLNTVQITSTPVGWTGQPGGERRTGGYGIGEIVEVRAWFTKTVWVPEGSAAMRLQVGPALRNAALYSGSGSTRLTFHYTVQAGDVADEGISIGPSALTGRIVDDLGNAAIADFDPLPADPLHKVDALRPAAAGPPRITSMPQVGHVYGLGEVIRLRVVFDEPVWVEADADGAEPVLLIDMGRATVPARFVEGSGSPNLQFRYIVRTGDFDRDGIAVNANALRSGVIRDSAGNTWGEPERRVPALPAQAGHTVNSGTDIDPPVVTGRPTFESAPERGDFYRIGETIRVGIAFSEVVHVSEQPSLALSIGANTRQAPYASGSGTTMLLFTYTVQAGDEDRDGISIGPGPGVLSGGAIRDDGGNPAGRDFASVHANAAHKVDGVAPAVTATPEITSNPASGDAYGIGELVEVKVVFDDEVQTTGDVVLALRIGTATREAALAEGGGTNTLTFRYAVQEGDLDEDGVGVAADALRGGDITDAVGNAATRGLPPLAPQTKHKVDGVRATATVAITSSPASGDTYRAGENITVAVTFSETVREPAATGLRLTLTVGSAARAAAFVRRNEDERTLAFRYTVAYGDIDADGVSVEGDALTGGAVTDLAGNPVQSAIALADQAGHKVDTSVTLELNAIALTVGGAPAQVNLTTVLDYTGLYNAPTTSDANVAVARVSGHRLTITPVAEGNAVVTIAAQSTAEIVLNIPVVVTASPAEIAVLKQTLAAMGRGMFASAAHTIGSRLELGPRQRRMSLLVGGRRFDPQEWEQSPAVWPHGNVNHAGLDAVGRDFGGWHGDYAAGPPNPARHGEVHGANAPLGRGFAPRSEQMWRGTAFEMPLLGTRGRSGAWSLWGGGDFSSFAGEPGDNAFDGSLSAMYIGMDGRGPGWVAGGAIGRISADASYEYDDVDTAGKGNLETSLTTFHPYVGWSFSDKAKAWVVAGFGTGEASMRRDGAQYDATPTDLTMRMGLVGARGVLGEPGGFDIAVRADAGTLSLETGSGAKAIDDLAVAVQRVRLGVELSYTADNAPVVGGVRLAGGGGGGGSFTPFVEVAARFDGGDEQSGTGAEVAAGVRYQGPTVSFEAKARTLAMHEAEDYSETGASATLVVSPRGNDGRGLRLSVSPRWGGAAEATDAFFQRDYAARAAQRHNAGSTAYDEWRANARVEYGMGLRGRAGTVTPFAETDVGGAGGKRARLGFSYETKARHGAPVRVNVSGERVQDARGTEHRLLIGAEGRF